MSEDGFLSRWSRRKQSLRHGRDEPEPAGPVAAEACAKPVAVVRPSVEPAPSVAPPAVPSTVPSTAPPAEPAAAEPPLPTLEDVAHLSGESDFSRFVAPGVDENVKRAAMKKLFADPRYNVMDGLDTYIDDYGKPDPIPAAMLRQMTQAAFLGLFDDEKPQEQGGDTDGAAFDAVPQSTVATETTAAPSTEPDPASDEDPDLRLQPDDAAGRGGADPSAPAHPGRID